VTRASGSIPSDKLCFFKTAASKMVQEEACIELLWLYHAAHDIALYMNYFN
jgi:hypothetical protein